MKWSYLVVISILLASLLTIGSVNYHYRKKRNRDPIQLKVATYNVDSGKKASAKEIGEALKPYHFDIVCLSEVPGEGWIKKVADVLGLDHIMTGRYPTKGQENQYKSIISRTPLYGYKEVTMLDTSYTATKAKTKIEGKEIAIYSVHFPPRGSTADDIRHSTQKIDDFVFYLKRRQQEEDSIVMGDFNFTLESLHYKMLKNAGLQAFWEDLPHQASLFSSVVTNTLEGSVIDHIMYSSKQVKALEGLVIEMKKPLSDHKPVWALLQLKK